MPIKTTGAEFKRFYDDPKFWPEDGGDTYHDDVLFYIDGSVIEDGYDISDVPDGAQVKIEGGTVFSPNLANCMMNFETYFRRWKKLQTTSVVLVECDVSRVGEMKAAIKKCGAKIL